MAVTAPPETATVAPRQCRRCGQTKPLDEFTRNNRAGRLHTCKACTNARKSGYVQRLAEAGDPRSSSAYRAHRAAVRVGLGHGLVEDAPNPAPARLLAELLLEDRDRWGFAFEQAWDENIEFVLARINGYAKVRDREQWREAFEATRGAWEAAWHRQPDGPGSGLTRALLDALGGAESHLG